MPVGRTADEGPRAHVDQLSTGPWRGRRHSARPIMSIETAQKTKGLRRGGASQRHSNRTLQDASLGGFALARLPGLKGLLNRSNYILVRHGRKTPRDKAEALHVRLYRFISSLYIGLLHLTISLSS